MNILAFPKVINSVFKLYAESFYSLIYDGKIKTVPLSGGTVNMEDIFTALRILLDRSSWKDGSKINIFEEFYRQYINTDYAFSFNGARVALRAILEAMDIGTGDDVILPGYTCVVVPNAILFRKANPVYVDIEKNKYSFSTEQFLKNLTNKTKAVIIQYTYGIVPDNVEAIIQLARERNIKVIEDCAPALGAEYKGKKVGTLGDAAIFSTEQTKCISTQFGGIAVTNDSQIGERLAKIQRSLPFPENNQIRLRLFQFIFNYFNWHPSLSSWFKPINSKIQSIFDLYIQNMNEEELSCIESPKHYSRMPNALASLGIRQLKNIDRYNEHRRTIAEIYNGILPSYTRILENGCKHTYLRYPVLISADRDFVLNKASADGIPLGEWFNSVIHPKGVPINKLMYKPGSCPQAEKVADKVINLPTNPHITIRDAEKIGNFIVQFLR